jgi:protein-L-isoaspartate(D-aspartate) O-methyltransferase
VPTLRQMDTEAQFAASAETLRAALVGQLRQQGAIRSDRVAGAFRVVPRHVFVLGGPLERAYANDSVVTKRDEQGSALSSVSAPWLQATMLEQAQLGLGMRALEVGSGGFNAALMAELAGQAGEVTTVDIDPEVTGRAARCLADAGYARVNVVLADAEDGVKEHAPYDRIIVTAGAWDIPPAWVDQLAEGGRIVVPLRMRGLTRSVAFERADGHLVSLGHEMCGFVPMQGAGARQERLVPLHGDDVGLQIDDGQPADAEALGAALLQPRAEAWSGVRFGGSEPFDGLYLWLAACLPGFGLLTRQRTDAARALADPSSPNGTPTLVDGGSFAYHTFRAIDPAADIYEFGAYAHGQDAARLAEQMAGQIRVWDREHRHGPAAQIAVYPAGTPDEQLLGGRVIDKRHTRVTISWP